MLTLEMRDFCDIVWDETKRAELARVLAKHIHRPGLKTAIEGTFNQIIGLQGKTITQDHVSVTINKKTVVELVYRLFETCSNYASERARLGSSVFKIEIQKALTRTQGLTGSRLTLELGVLYMWCEPGMVERVAKAVEQHSSRVKRQIPGKLPDREIRSVQKQESAITELIGSRIRSSGTDPVSRLFSAKIARTHMEEIEKRKAYTKAHEHEVLGRPIRGLGRGG